MWITTAIMLMWFMVVWTWDWFARGDINNEGATEGWTKLEEVCS
jgi:hypothetical protein